MEQASPRRCYRKLLPPRAERNTVIDNVPQVAIRHVPSNIKLILAANPDHGLLTPRPMRPPNTITPSSVATSDTSSMWSKRDSKSSYDSSLYGVSDNDAEEIPLKCSESLKRTVARTQKRPSVVIPSARAWSSAQKIEKVSACSIGLSPAANSIVSPGTLAFLKSRTAQVPSTSATPSLDGSLTSEELALSSCPSTPDVQKRIDDEQEWEPPAQLHPDAMDTLHHMGPEEHGSHPREIVIEFSDEISQEMLEIIRDTPVRHDFALLKEERKSDEPQSAAEPISALTIPSPGGFFSLNTASRHTWASTPTGPSTSVAEHFYRVPWSIRPADTVERLIEQENALDSGPPTARRLHTSTAGIEVAELTDEPGFNSATYQGELQRTAIESFDRTKVWLSAQTTYSLSIPASDHGIPSTLGTGTPPAVANLLLPPKSVHLIETILENSGETHAPHAPRTPDTPVFFHGFQHLTARKRSRDAFLHRQARAEAIHVARQSLAKEHRAQMNGSFEINSIYRPTSSRPISFLPTVSEAGCQKEPIAQAERERQALEQIKPSVWELQVTVQIFSNGKLLASPASRILHSQPGAQILDFGGQASCDWGWQVAITYPSATITTVIPSSTQQSLSPDRHHPCGPRNHHIVTARKLWSLPFPDGHFDLVSARTLHVLLRTTTTATSPFPTATSSTCSASTPDSSSYSDEYDRTLAELHRILKPGGHLEFTLLDAALVHAAPGTTAQALSVEFAFALRARGYDPCASRAFLPRLTRAGFVRVRRAWLLLPAADVLPRWVDRGKLGATTVAGVEAGVTTTTTARVKTRCFEVCRPGGGAGVDGGPGNLSDGAVTGSTADVAALTGLVGARMWERWMLKLQSEIGAGEGGERTMERVGKALEEAGKSGAAWRCLTGWARKGE